MLGIAFAVAGRSSFWLIVAMNLLILAVAWAYTQICRIYPDGGGVYTAARNKHALLGVLAALLLFADYTVTASLSTLDGFHYFGLEQTTHVSEANTHDAGDQIVHEPEEKVADKALAWYHPDQRRLLGNRVDHRDRSPQSPGAEAFQRRGRRGRGSDDRRDAPRRRVRVAENRLGHAAQQTGVATRARPHRPLAQLRQYRPCPLPASKPSRPSPALMKKPVAKTASRSIWIVAAEVSIFNVLLTVAMLNIPALDRYAHKDDMLAYMAGYYVGPWGEQPIRILAGLLLLSAANTAIGALMGLLYVLSRDDEMPAVFQKLNSFGTPWVARWSRRPCPPWC